MTNAWFPIRGQNLSSAWPCTVYTTLLLLLVHLIPPVPKDLHCYVSFTQGHTHRLGWDSVLGLLSACPLLAHFHPSVWDGMLWSATSGNLGLQMGRKLLIGKRSFWEFCIPLAQYKLLLVWRKWLLSCEFNEAFVFAAGTSHQLISDTDPKTSEMLYWIELRGWWQEDPVLFLFHASKLSTIKTPQIMSG